jgi:lysophospholipase L1-like esterase
VALRDVAASRAVTVVDLWSVSGGPRRTTCAADHYHPSDEGYRRWARALVEALPHPAA